MNTKEFLIQRQEAIDTLGEIPEFMEMSRADFNELMLSPGFMYDPAIGGAYGVRIEVVG